MTAKRGLRRAVLAAAAVAAVWSAAAALTGGFTLDLGLVRVSSRDPYRPLAAALGLIGLLWLLARQEFGSDIAAVAGRPGTRWARLSLAVAIASLVAGVAWNTRAAGGSDSYCYIGQAEQFLAGHALLVEPLAKLAPAPRATLMFAPTGWVPSRTVPFSAVPICGPGLSLTMALVWKLFGPWFIHAIVPLLGALAVWLTFVLGRRLDRPVTGASAALLLATSPIFLFQIVQPMSDVPATAWWLAALACAARRSSLAQAGSGLLASAAILTRPNLAVLVLPIGVFIAAAPAGDDLRPSWRERFAGVLRFGVALAAGCVPLAWLNAIRYGSPFSSGYGDPAGLFTLAHVPPNLARYPRWLVSSQTWFVCLAAFAPWVAATRKTDAADSRAATALTWTCLSIVLITFACYLPYVVFEEWWYIRFLLPALPLILLLSAAVTRRLLSAGSLPPAALFVCACLLAGWYLHVARERGVFGIRSLEARYIVAGQYAGRALPPDAVVLTIQDSGSVRQYGRRTTLPWDAIPPRELDRTLAWLRGIGRRPYIMVEAWEEPGFRRRFAGQQAGALDWPPRARVLTAVRVLLYDPEDRARYLAGQRVIPEDVR